MTVKAKICGLSTPAAVDAARTAGAEAVGFVFYPPSPRAVTPATAGMLAPHAGKAMKVGLFVDPVDQLLDEVLGTVPLDLIQLHGAESPGRVAAISKRAGLPAMKAIKIRRAGDIAAAAAYEDAAWLLFDAKAPAHLAGALPGGNGVSFDWRLLAGRRWCGPWMLSGGLDANNVAEAVRTSGADWVDVSSGVETSPGTKSPALIARFMAAVRSIA